MKRSKRKNAMKTQSASLTILTLGLALFGAAVTCLHAATFTVTSTADSGPGTLRQALAGAGNGDTIDATGVSGVVVLNNSALSVSNSVTILGPGPAALTLQDPFPNVGVFNITGSNVTISGLTVANSFGSNGTGIHAAGGSLTVSNCAFSGNQATNGGGIYTTNGSLTVNNCSFLKNGAVNGGGIYNINSPVIINNSSFTSNSSTSGGGIFSEGYNEVNATMTINASTFTGNSSTSGGGIFNEGNNNGTTTMTINACTFTGNSSSNDGGAIVNEGFGGSATLTINASTLTGNSASNIGGGIENEGFGGTFAGEGGTGNATVTINASTLSTNTASAGGGVYSEGTDYELDPSITSLFINNSTFSFNSASSTNGGGGAILSQAAVLQINASTFNGNCTLSSGINAFTGTVAFLSGGKAALPNGTAKPEFYGGVNLKIADTILNAGGTYPNIAPGGMVTSEGYNLASDNASGYLTGPGDQTNANPMLGPLQNNGGPTWTHALLPGSPAIDQGKLNLIAGLSTNIDQRGLPRPVDNPNIANAVGGDGSDIGAYEVQFSSLTLQGQPVPGQPGQMNLSYLPWATGWTYTLQFSTNLTAMPFAPLTGFSGPVTNGNQVIFTDPNATNTEEFYRLQISPP